MSSTIITINLVILNGEKYIRHCLDAVFKQSYPHNLIEFNILDNNSTDNTAKIIDEFKIYELGFKKFNLIKNNINLGVWPAQEKLLEYSTGKYILGLCVDVILEKDFLKNAVEAMERDNKIGALEAKIYKYDFSDLESKTYDLKSSVIDTCGFQISKSRRISNIGHGENDLGQFNELKEIFGVEGAAPFFRREAIDDCKIQGEFADHKYFWYGDDLDFSWRMNLFGWKQIFSPKVIAWHDRQTTKNVRKNFLDYILRVPVRQRVPIRKRRLDWRNTRFTIIKNDYIINILRDLPAILSRELAVFGYTLLFESKVLAELPTFLMLLPDMLKKRREIMKKAVVPAKEMRKWFN